MQKEGGFFSNHKTSIAATTLVGTIVGAGILGIPYVIAQTGILYGAILMLILGVVYLLLHLILGEIVLSTKGKHQIPGYVEKYLGKWGKYTISISLFIHMYGALIAYLIGEGVTLYAIFKVGAPIYYTLGFFIIGSYIVYKGVKTTGKTELIMIAMLIFIVGLIGLFSFDHLSITNFAPHDLSKLFIPFGVILFAYTGLPAVPEMNEQLEKKKTLLKKSIIVGSIIPIILYLAFTFIIVGIVGLENFNLIGPNERIATVALSMYTNPILGVFANLLAVIAMFTSFLTIAVAISEMYTYDYNFPKWAALILTLLFPLFIALFELTTFITVIGITGAIGGGIDGILIILSHWKIKKLRNRKPEYELKLPKIIGLLMILLFIFGILHQIWINLF